MSPNRDNAPAIYLEPEKWADQAARKPGTFTIRPAPHSRVMEAVLPSGDLVSLPLRPSTGSGASWDFNGDLQRPTLSPSVLYRCGDWDGDRSTLKERWHGWLRNGEWVSC